MWSYIIPILAVTLIVIVYGLFNLEDDDGSPKEEGGPDCGQCAQKDACGGEGHDGHIHFEIHKPYINPVKLRRTRD